MNSIAGNVKSPNLRVSGECLLGAPGDTDYVDIDAMRSEVGFVPQDDIMHDGLTVYQNIYFSAMLRLPAGMSHAQKIGIIEDVLNILDLQAIRNSVVGGAGSARGISGGQKKRVNIGLELVAYPRILFLDEPTSGLDSTASFRVVKCLQRLKALGITTVAVIHQPSFKTFSAFSDLVLL